MQPIPSPFFNIDKVSDSAPSVEIRFGLPYSKSSRKVIASSNITSNISKVVINETPDFTKDEAQIQQNSSGVSSLHLQMDSIKTNKDEPPQDQNETVWRKLINKRASPLKSPIRTPI